MTWDRVESWQERIAALPVWLSGSVAAGVGLREREDTVLPTTGGPAGNARLTAWTGLLLFVTLAAEGITLIDVRGLISWHVAIGAILVPLSVVKIGATGWRMVRYYLGARAYRVAGPPPVLLRLLAPLLVVATIALLASGVVLVLLGEERGRSELFTVGPLRVDWVWLHQASFIVWLVVTTVHVLGRLVPGLFVAGGTMRSPAAVPGIAWRLVSLAAAGVLGVLLAVVLVRMDASWSQAHDLHHELDRSRQP